MKTIFNTLLFFVLLACTYSSLRKPICTGIGMDCSWTNLCCEGYYCVNDRCQREKGEDTMEYTPKTNRCNDAHWCPSNYKCESHRCILMTDVAIDENIAKRKFLVQKPVTTVNL